MTRRIATQVAAAVLAAVVVLQVPTVAQQARSRLEVLPVQGNVYMIAGAGGNIAVQIGEAGVLMVDTGDGQMNDQLLAAIRQLSPKTIRFIINTHYAPDTTGGNVAFAVAGSSIPEVAVGAGHLFADQDAIATIAAHENVQKRMSAPVGKQAPTPTKAWPVLTYFNDEKEMVFNGEPVVLVHTPKANTDGDSLVFFRHSDVLAVGDTFTTVSYPVIEISKGGTINGIIAALNKIIDITIPAEKQEGGTYVIPTHGRICDESDVVTYRDMVTIIRDRVQVLKNKGQTLEQVKATKPTEDYDTHFPAPGAWTTDKFIDAVYQTLPPPAAAAKTAPAPKGARTPAPASQRR